MWDKDKERWWIYTLLSLCSPKLCIQKFLLNCWLGLHELAGRKWQPTPVSLPGKCHGQRSQVGCSPWGCKELGTTEWLTLRMKVVETKDWALVDTYLHVINQNWVIASYSSGMEAEILNISNPHSTAKLVMRLKFWICISWAVLHHLLYHFL